MTSLLKKLVASAALAMVLTMAVASTAYADADDHDWRRHQVKARYWHRHHPRPVYTDVYAPPVIVSPPPVYYPPPQPVYAVPVAPSLNFVIPLHIH